jgi:c-di-GMP-related signal transduction protein
MMLYLKSKNWVSNSRKLGEIFETVQKMGIDFSQGFYFGRPDSELPE